MSDRWDAEKIELLKALIAERPPLNRVQIAARMGVSKNTVIGAMYRMGLSSPRPAETEELIAERAERKRESARKYRQKQLAKQRPANPNWGFSGGVKVKVNRKPNVAFTPTGEPVSRKLSVVNLVADDCRFIAGEVRPFTYCAHPVMSGQRYCDFHCRIVYTPQGYDRIVKAAA